jgi:hypothetical protein
MQVKLKLLHLYSVLLLIDILAFFYYVATAGAYDPLDPTGTVTMKWDIMFWTTDGYIVSARSIAQIMTKFIIPYAYSIKANDSNMARRNLNCLVSLNFLQSDTHSLPNLCLRLPKQ